MRDGMTCRTPEEAFQAGWDDGADDRPLDDEELTRMVALLGPGIREQMRKESEVDESAMSREKRK